MHVRSLLGCVLVLAVAGCSSGTGNSLSGKVTFKDKAVVGTLVLLGPDKKEVRVPLGGDGGYTASNLLAGDYVVTITPPPGMNPGQTPPPPPKDAPLPKETGEMKGMPTPPPAKYAQPNNGLKVTVSGGAQTQDFPLTQ